MPAKPVKGACDMLARQAKGAKNRMHTIRYRAVGSALLLATVLSTWRLTPVAAATTTIFSNSFDSQSAGALVTGADVNQFGGVAGASNLSVENTVAASAPNALSVTLNAAGFAFAAKQFSSAYTNYTLTFNLQLGPDVTVPISDYLVLAQTVPIISSNAGKVDVILPADDRIRLDYSDSAGQHHFLWGSFVVPKGSWHSVELRETVGAGSGTLALLVDGNTVASGSSLDLGTQGVTWFGVGERFSLPGSATAGHLYIDDVNAATTT
jgi:hypothetical protein